MTHTATTVSTTGGAVPTIEWAASLNLIDVVYSDIPKIVELWHELYAILHQVPLNEQQRVHKYTQLLLEMAKTLGYKSLQQVDIDKFYSPQTHGNIVGMNYETQVELLSVLKATQHLTIAPKEIEINKLILPTL